MVLYYEQINTEWILILNLYHALLEQTIKESHSCEGGGGGGGGGGDNHCTTTVTKTVHANHGLGIHVHISVVSHIHPSALTMAG